MTQNGDNGRNPPKNKSERERDRHPGSNAGRAEKKNDSPYKFRAPGNFGAAGYEPMREETPSRQRPSAPGQNQNPDPGKQEEQEYATRRIPNTPDESRYDRNPNNPNTSGRPGETHIRNGSRRSTESKAQSPTEKRTSVRTAAVREEEPHRRVGSLFGAILYFGFIVGISAILAAFIWVSANDVLALVKPEIVAEITIEKGDTLSDISDKLKNAGLIEYPWLFNLYGKFSDAEEKIDPGVYNIDAAFDYRAMVYAMSDRSQYRTTVWVTIPEGFELKEIFKRLEEKGVCKADELKKTADTYKFKHDFLQDVPMRENRLEGYLFPSTYEFYTNEKPVNVLNVMLLAYGDKFNADLRKRADDLGLTMHEVTTIASLIEREASIDDERSLVSSVIHNRLGSSKYPRLQIDATIQYVLPERKEKLSEADTQIDNPYNTYMYEGLPPGPIACPGLASIKAALYPENTDYYFYALDEGGAHKFSKTLDEHNKFLESKK